jgi:hypothetical protein
MREGRNKDHRREVTPGDCEALPSPRWASIRVKSEPGAGGSCL